MFVPHRSSSRRRPWTIQHRFQVCNVRWNSPANGRYHSLSELSKPGPIECDRDSFFYFRLRCLHIHHFRHRDDCYGYMYLSHTCTYSQHNSNPQYCRMQYCGLVRPGLLRSGSYYLCPCIFCSSARFPLHKSDHKVPNCSNHPKQIYILVESPISRRSHPVCRPPYLESVVSVCRML